MQVTLSDTSTKTNAWKHARRVLFSNKVIALTVKEIVQLVVENQQLALVARTTS
jgi:hypothetical protein